MKSKIYNIIGAMLLGVALSACHEDSDVLMSYDHTDAVAFAEAGQSFAGKFKVTWNGLNQYYGIWDYEAKNGLDWDATYNEYLPQFEALDARDKNENPVTDKELRELMQKFLSPLHDGHLTVDWKNHHTGKFCRYSPSWTRARSRDDYKIAGENTPHLNYYKDLNNGKVLTDESGNAAVSEASTLWFDMLYTLWNTEGSGVMWIKAKMEEYEKKTLPTDHEVYQYTGMKALLEELNKLTYDGNGLARYNELALQFAFLEVPGLNMVDKNFADYGVAVRSAMLKGNTGGIAYLYFSDFMLSPYISSDTEFNMNDSNTANLVSQVKAVWDFWFNNIQDMHKKGTLEGIIIDLRGNGGGLDSDEQYIMGALIPQGDFQYGWMRYKRGTGRYDYSPLMPAMTTAMNTELTNSGSVSMSEMTATIAQCLPNGKVIGKRSAGGLCGLDDNRTFSYNYAGYVGVENETPVYCYVPSVAEMDMNKNIREGVGVTPDIEVDLDATKFKSTGEDSQLERAIEYIKTGK